MKLHQIGELNLLREIRKRFSSTDSNIIVGIGDDAAVISPPEGLILITTDMMNEGIHFDLNFTSAYQLGFKLISVNVSDIMAMGGSPEYLFLDISLKGDIDEDFFWNLFEGISTVMGIYKMRLAGGDLCAAKNDTVLSATVIGSGNSVVTRKGASVGDKIYVTGNIGDSACGLEILKKLTDDSREIIKNLYWGNRHKNAGVLEYWSNDLKNTIARDIAEPLIRRHLMPIARDSSDIAKYATAMIDISDGLFIDLCRICDESSVGARVYLDKIPISYDMKRVAEIMRLDPLHLATSGGEDYELLFTASEEFGVRSSEFGVNITCIGEITEKDRIAVDKRDREFPIKAEGYQHFGISG